MTGNYKETRDLRKGKSGLKETCNLLKRKLVNETSILISKVLYRAGSPC